MGRVHTFTVTLKRDNNNANWGLRLVGGADLATPLIVTRVTPGTPAGKELLRGDIIAKIDDYDARDLRHQDAQNLFRTAGNQIRIVVQRTQSPLPPPPYRPGPESLPRSPMPDERSSMLSPVSTRTDDTLDENIQLQPYRTTPLVLPGAKVRREPGPTESYLRHHPNPAMRQAPHHDLRETLMRQKAPAGAVHKQYNSPINMYSDQNIANSYRQQTSPLPSNGHYGRPTYVKRHKPTLLYDPAKSETFRLLQEEGLGDIVQEVPIPVETKVFTAPPNKRPVPTPKPKTPVNQTIIGKTTTYVSTLKEDIQQSNSFKRLMYNVLGETDF